MKIKVSYRIIASFFLASIPVFSLFAQKNEWLDPNINEINRAPVHADYFAYESEGQALAGAKESSANFLTLNGYWKFNWVKDAGMRPLDFYKKDFNDKAWTSMPVPGIWEVNGFGDPLYTNIAYPWSNQFTNNPPIVPEADNHVGSYTISPYRFEGGTGLRFYSDTAVSMSALHYAIGSLDDGNEKHQRHGLLVPQVNYTNICIDKVQMGLGCVTSWGALPIEKYRLHYGNYEFSFIMEPVINQF